MGFLDEKGLAHFWESAQPSMVRGMTKAEFDALPEEDRRGLIIVKDAASVSQLPREDGNNERVIAYTHDGRPIYERRFSAAMVTDYNTTADYDIADWDIDEVRNINACIKNSSSGGVGQLPLFAYRTSDGAFNTFMVFVINGHIRLQNISNAKAASTWFGSETTVTVQFTKTTG